MPTYTSNHDFTSWPEFIAQACDSKRYAWHGKKASHRINNADWSGTNSFSEAVGLATRGWPEGRAKMSEAVAQAKPAREQVAANRYDVGGERPDITRAIAGDPMSMVTRGQTMRAAHPVVRIDCCAWYSAYVDAAWVTNRGAALLSICDSLENAGYSVELRLVGASEAGSQRFQFAMPYKLAGEALDIDRAAFALLHPSVLRRFLFAIMEQDAMLEASYQYGYGAPQDVREQCEDGVIYIPAPSSEHDTPEAARAVLERTFAQFLDQA